jgi:hypothetical protein
VRKIDAGDWRIDWSLDAKTTFSARSLSMDGETDFIADGWGQRDSLNADQGATLPYIVRRCAGPDERRFVAVYESHPADRPFVKRLRLDGQTLAVETADGTDYIDCSDEKLDVKSMNILPASWEFHHVK